MTKRLQNPKGGIAQSLADGSSAPRPDSESPGSTSLPTVAEGNRDSSERRASRSRKARVSRSKGIRFENEIAKLLAERTGLPIRRTLDQTRSGGHDIPCGGFRIQAKHRRSMSLPAWWRQAKTEAGPFHFPILVVKRHGGGVVWWFSREQSTVWLNAVDVVAQRVIDEEGIVGIGQEAAIRAIVRSLRRAAA